MMNSRIKEDNKKIFEFWCNVTRLEGDSKATGVIIQSFPESFRDDQIITKIPDFAYPCEFENDSVQTYSFVLTSDDSKWRFGFCRHDPKTQSAMIFITYLPWHDTFLRLLGVLGELRRTNTTEFADFLAEIYNKEVPDPGASLKVFYDNGQNHFTFQRPSKFQLPSIPLNHNLNIYYNFVNPKNMISVFAAMLAERRIIFTSRRLDRLSSCIQAANAFLYPMVWQHIFIPILPMKLKDMLMAPMPYLIGVPTPVLESMTADELGDVVILNCDTKTFESPFQDVEEMPEELVNQMKKHLNNPHEHMGDRVSKIFLGVLVQLIGGYRDAVRYFHGQKIIWEQDKFIESRQSHLRPYLTRLMQMQIFQQFIDDRLEMINTGSGFSDEFELETVRYAEKMDKRGRPYKEFLKNVKDKTNPAVKSAVKSVKEGSRGMKTAYKDLKSKFRDVTPPKTNFHSHVSNSHHDGIDGLNKRTADYHHSAPSSPVFNKHQGNSSLNESVRKPTPILNSNSNSHLHVNGFVLLPNLNNNNLANSSPTISPSSSVCSSEMNISQELQNHPLFKVPAVDRSLKPSSSIESNSRTTLTSSSTTRFGAPLAKPQPQQKKTAAIANNAIKTSPHQMVSGNLTNIDPSTNGQTSGQSKVFITDSMLDTPPDIPTPPIPPRRYILRQIANNKSTVTNCVTSSAEYPVIGLVDKNSSMNICDSNLIGFENDFGSVAAEQLPLAQEIGNICRNRNQVPTPAPRLKKEQSMRTLNQQDDTMNDLISLEDSNHTSFELEDFDPLNQNAKQIPSSSRSIPTGSSKTYTLPASPAGSMSTKSSILPSTSLGSCVYNPIYPYFTPQHRNAITQKHERKDNDLELLRKYGLDQFTLTANNTTAGSSTSGDSKSIISSAIKSNHITQQTSISNNKNNWTTFD